MSVRARLTVAPAESSVETMLRWLAMLPAVLGSTGPYSSCLDSSFHWSNVPGLPASAQTRERAAVIEMMPWASSELLSHAAAILLRDALGVNTSFVVGPTSVGTWDRVGQGAHDGGPAAIDATMEVWPSTSLARAAAIDYWSCGRVCNSGGDARSGSGGNGTCLRSFEQGFGGTEGQEALVKSSAHGPSNH